MTALSTLVQDNAEYAVAAVFLLGFAESLVLVALFVPSTVFFAGIGATYAAAGGTLEALWVAGALGATAGDTLSFGLGRYFRDDAAKRWPLNQFPDLITRGERLFAAWGWLAIVISKFAFGLRPFVPVVAGIVAMPVVRFLAASAISCVIWAGSALGLGYAATIVVRRAFGSF
ncbi:MAG: DedA family protein [Hyphomicrobiaceae bacterium]